MAIVAALLAATVVRGEPQTNVLEPPAAIALAQGSSLNGKPGRFAMTVAAAAKTKHRTFLNSTEDYRRPDNVTFSLAPHLARTLLTKFGEPPERYLLGKRVIVDGRIRRQPIFDTRQGRLDSFNRFQNTVEVEAISQIVTVSDPT